MTRWVVTVEYVSGCVECRETVMVEAKTAMLACEAGERDLAMQRDGTLRHVAEYFASKVREEV